MSIQFEYFYGSQAEQFSFYRIPKVLFTDETLAGISVEAKVLYSFMLDRMSLSVKNCWFDEENRVYIIYTIDDILSDFGCERQKALKLLDELENGIGLVPSQQRWTQKSFKKRNESQYFVNLLKSTALFHGLLAGDLCRHDVPLKERSSPRAIRPGTSLSYRLLIVKQLSRHKC